MCEPARRWRLLATVALVLALAQGRAWGEPSLWTKAANLTCRVGNLPRELIRKPRPAAQPPAPIFAWEKKDAAEWDYAVGTFWEAIRDYEWAYCRYKMACRRSPGNVAFAAAARRARAAYGEDDYIPEPASSGFTEPASSGFGMYPVAQRKLRLDDVFSWLTVDELPAIQAFSWTFLPCPDGEHSDGPLSNELLYGEKPEPCDGYSPWIPKTRFDMSLFDANLPKDRSFSMFSRPAAADATAPALPGRKDMLSDSDFSRTLTDLGVVADRGELLSLPLPEDGSGIFIPGFGFYP